MYKLIIFFITLVCVTGALFASVSESCSNTYLFFTPYGESYLTPPTSGLNDTDVLHNNLTIEAIPVEKRLIGTSELHIKSKSLYLTDFVFRLDDTFTVTDIKVNNINANWFRLPVDPNSIQVDLPEIKTYNQTFTVSISYNGIPASSGLGSIIFTTHNYVPIVFTLSEPWYAYTWMPVKEDLNDKLTCNISVICPDSYYAVSNGTLVGTEILSGSRMKYNWSADEYPMAAYLMCFSLTNYNTWTEQFAYGFNQMPVSFFLYPESDNSSNRASLANTVPMLRTFSDLFGIYPFINEKYSIYQFSMTGGMEHQTCTGQGFFSESLNSHELAHQWWGDMITCKTWNDIWLNEGFATYSEALWVENKPNQSNPAIALKNYMNSKKPTSSLGTVYCWDATTVNRIFSSDLSYKKGGWVLHQLRHVVSDETFYDILAEYRNRYAFQSATTADFRQVCEDVYGKNLDWFFDEWVYYGGAPSYVWSWKNVQSNGKYYLAVNIQQTQTAAPIPPEAPAPSPDYPTFTMPIDLNVNYGTSNQTYVVTNDSSNEYFVIPITSAASDVLFDNNGWILKGSLIENAYTEGPPVVVETTPSPGSFITANPTWDITYHKQVNTSASDYELRDHNSNIYPITFSYNQSANTAAISSQSALPIGLYSLTIKDSVTAYDNNALLDGETINNTLPSGNGNAGGNCVLMYAVPYTIQGNVILSSYWGNPAGIPIAFKFKQNNEIIKQITINLDANGHYSVDCGLFGVYDIVVKADRWLSYKLANVNLNGNTTLDLNFELSGDTNNDNMIDDFDLNNINGMFGSVPPVEMSSVDLTGDGVIDDFDLNLVNGLFGSVGDE